MASDAEWVEDVKRWYFAGQGTTGRPRTTDPLDPASTDAVGYEAADPALQARHWPDAPVGDAARSPRVR
jgi:hypothetical protein